MFMSEKTMVRQSFLPRFLPRKRLKIHKYCGSISFSSSPLWLKTSQIFRHMANIFAFGDVASGQRHNSKFLLKVREYVSKAQKWPDHTDIQCQNGQTAMS